MEDARADEVLVKRALSGELVEPPVKEAPVKSENLRRFNVFVNDQYFEVGVDALDGAPMVSYVQPPMAAPVPAALAAPAAAAPAPPTPPAPAAPAAAPEPAPAADVEGVALAAPMPGMIVRYEKQVGDEVSEGETIVVLEAMKMENALPSPATGTVKAINFASGDSVAKGDVLCVIG